MPTYRVVVSTANYVMADTPEKAAEKVLNWFESRSPNPLRAKGAWKIVSVEEDHESPIVDASSDRPADTPGERQ
jgi:hypothetical protein